MFDAHYDYVLPFKDGIAEVRRRVHTVNPVLGVLAGAIAVGTGYIGGGHIMDEHTKRGYIDNTGREIVSTKNNFTDVYENGLARVSVKDRWGVVDQKGSYIIEPKYEAMSRFSEGLAAVQAGGVWGYVNEQGVVSIMAKYDEAHDFHEGVASVRKGELWRVIDTSGISAFQLPAGVTALGDFSDGLMPVKIGEKWGYMDHKGTMVIAPQYDEAQTFS